MTIYFSQNKFRHPKTQLSVKNIEFYFLDPQFGLICKSYKLKSMIFLKDKNHSLQEDSIKYRL